jgi:hypothetical protein
MTYRQRSSEETNSPKPGKYSGSRPQQSRRCTTASPTQLARKSDEPFRTCCRAYIGAIAEVLNDPVPTGNVRHFETLGVPVETY